MSKGLTLGTIKKYFSILFKKGISFEEFDINNGTIEVGDICKEILASQHLALPHFFFAHYLTRFYHPKKL